MANVILITTAAKQASANSLAATIDREGGDKTFTVAYCNDGTNIPTHYIAHWQEMEESVFSQAMKKLSAASQEDLIAKLAAEGIETVMDKNIKDYCLENGLKRIESEI